MTPNEITTLIASNFDREFDFPFRLQLMERVRYWRSRLVANSLQKDPNQRKFFRQTLYLKMHSTPNVPCAELISCPVAQTVEELPILVRAGSVLFDYVGSVDGLTPYREALPGALAFQQDSHFAKMFPYYEYTNNHLVVSNPELPLLRVDGIFDDPMAALRLSCSQQAKPCDEWNSTFPCSGELMQLIVQSIISIDYNRPEQKATETVQ